MEVGAINKDTESIFTPEVREYLESGTPLVAMISIDQELHRLQYDTSKAVSSEIHLQQQ